MMLPFAGMMPEPPVVDVKSANFKLMNGSSEGTLKCKTHCQPSPNVPSAIALLWIVLTPVRASGVELAELLVVVDVLPLDPAVVNVISDDVAVPPASVDI